MNKEINLTETELTIINDVQTIRCNIQNTVATGSTSDYVFANNPLTEQAARLAIINLNILLCVSIKNDDAVKHLIESVISHSSNAGCTNYDTLIKSIAESANLMMQEHNYSQEDIRRLHSKLKGFIKSQKLPPARNLYISDCHFFHDGINRFMDKRGFAGYEEMNEYMIQKWNGKVTPRDHVYVLGDFSIAKGEKTNEILKKLNGKLHLIIGNHDKFLEDKNYKPGDEIGLKASFVWKQLWDETLKTGWKISETFLYGARINDSENRNLDTPYRKMDDKYRGFKMRFDVLRSFNFFGLPIGVGLDYEINKGNLFGFETGHRIGAYINLL